MQNKDEFRKIWNVYLLEQELAQNYPGAYALSGGMAGRNMLLDQLLPSFLLIRAVSILDEGFQIILNEKEINLPTKKYENTLGGRIGILGDSNIISKKSPIDLLRRSRNNLAHTPRGSTWNELRSAIDLIDFTLQELNLVGKRPLLEYFGTRSGAEAPNPPNPEIAFSYKYICGIKENNKPGIELSWIENIYNE